MVKADGEGLDEGTGSLCETSEMENTSGQVGGP